MSRTNIHRLSSVRGFGPVTHRFIGRGGWKTYEGTFALVRAWDPSLEGGPQEAYSPSTNAGFDSVRDVYRRWCLNEAGDYTGAPYHQGEAFDFSRVFERADYVRVRRRFEKAMSVSGGRPVGRHLEVSYDGGDSWQAYTDAFDVLDGECGVRLSSDVPGAEVWAAIAAGTLRFRMTAAVASDERLTVSVADGPVGSAMEVVDHVIAAGGFEYRKVSPASVYYGRGEADERDDSEALHAYVRQKCEARQETDETIDLETPIVAQFYQPGNRAACGDGRDVPGIGRNGRSVFVVERAAIDYERQCTRLRIGRSRRRI